MKSTGELQREILQLKQALQRAPGSPDNRDAELAAAALRARILILQQELERRREEVKAPSNWLTAPRAKAEPARRPSLFRRLLGLDE